MNQTPELITANLARSNNPPPASTTKKSHQQEKPVRMDFASMRASYTIKPMTPFFEMPIGCYAKHSNVKRATQSLNQLALPFTKKTKHKDNLLLTCIISGPYASRNEAIKMRTKIKQRINGQFNRIFGLQLKAGQYVKTNTYDVSLASCPNHNSVLIMFVIVPPKVDSRIFKRNVFYSAQQP